MFMSFLFLSVSFLQGNISQALSTSIPEICGPVTHIESKHSVRDVFQPIVTIAGVPYPILNDDLLLFSQDLRMSNYAFNHGKSICGSTPDGVSLTRIWLVY